MALNRYLNLQARRTGLVVSLVAGEIFGGRGARSGSMGRAEDMGGAVWERGEARGGAGITLHTIISSRELRGIKC